MKPLVIPLALVMLCSAPPPCLAQDYSTNCTDPTACMPATVPITVTLRRAYHVTRSVDFDYEVFGIGWEDRADLYARVTINGENIRTPSGDQLRGSDSPEFTNYPVQVFVPADLPLVEITVELFDRDPVSPDDPVDISSNPGANGVIFRFDLCSGEIFRPDLLGGPVVAMSGGIITVGGDDSDLDASDRADLDLTIETPILVPAQEYCDLQVTDCDLVQTLEALPFVIAERPAVMRVRLASTFDTDVTTEVECHVNDFVHPEVVRRFPVTIAACETLVMFFFEDAPLTIERGGNLVLYGAIVDPDGNYHTDNMPECMLTNDGSPSRGRKFIHSAPGLSVKAVRFSSGPGGTITEGEMNVAADAMRLWADRLFPVAGRVDVQTDPDVVEDPAAFGGTGPWSTIGMWSQHYLLTGGVTAIGLVPQEWLDAQNYLVFPDGRTGASLGKEAPGFAFAEIVTNQGSVPVHELCHTFGLSAEPCDGPFVETLWECEDEYNYDDFPAGPFSGSGYDFFGAVPGPFSGDCIMDRTIPPWISATDYTALLDAIEGEPDPRVLIVRGNVDALGNGQLDAAYGLAEGRPNRTRRDRSPFALVVLNDAREVLGEYGVMAPVPMGVFADNDGDDKIPSAIDQDGDCDLDPLDEDGDGVADPVDDDGLPDGDRDQNCIPDCFPVPHMDACQDELSFCLTIPWPANGVSLELRGPDGGIIAGLPIDELPTPIELLEPLGDIAVDPHEAVVVRWAIGLAATAATGTAPAAAPVMVAASYDGGQSWFPRAIVEDGDQYVLPNDGLERSVTMRVRVYALKNGLVSSSDGDAPTPTLLTGFRATPSPDGVVLIWSLSDDQGLIGYLLDRSDVAGGRVRITSSPVPAAGPRTELRFVDAGAVPGGRYAYTLLGLEPGGSERYLGQTSLDVSGGAPLAYAFGPISPNPTRRGAQIEFDLPERSRVRIAVFDVAGRPVVVLTDGEWEAGHHRLPWSGVGSDGSAVAAGVYFVRMRATSLGNGRRFDSRSKVVVVR